MTAEPHALAARAERLLHVRFSRFFGRAAVVLVRPADVSARNTFLPRPDESLRPATQLRHEVRMIVPARAPVGRFLGATDADHIVFRPSVSAFFSLVAASLAGSRERSSVVLTDTKYAWRLSAGPRCPGGPAGTASPRPTRAGPSVRMTPVSWTSWPSAATSRTTPDIRGDVARRTRRGSTRPRQQRPLRGRQVVDGRRRQVAHLLTSARSALTAIWGAARGPGIAGGGSRSWPRTSPCSTGPAARVVGRQRPRRGPPGNAPAVVNAPLQFGPEPPDLARAHALRTNVEELPRLGMENVHRRVTYVISVLADSVNEIGMHRSSAMTRRMTGSRHMTRFVPAGVLAERRRDEVYSVRLVGRIL